MSVTLDDVLSLLHFLIIGQFCNIEKLEFEKARSAIIELLGVDCGKVDIEMAQIHGLKVRLSCLRDIYDGCYE